MSKRVIFAGLFHETHTFIDATTGLNDFQIRLGDDMLDCLGDSSPLGGALESARHWGWEIIPTVDMRASPSAIVEDEVLEHFWNEFSRRIPTSIDAFYLVLHGAMVTQSFSDVEGEILDRLRRKIGNAIPIFGVFDLHANFSKAMADLANCLVAYRENPHIDGRRAAQIAADLLQRTLSTGEIPKMLWRHPLVMWPPTGTATASDPMRSLEQLARSLEAESPNLWAVSVCAGFAYADTFDTGVSFAIAFIGDEADAVRSLEKLSSMSIEQRALGNSLDPTIDEVFAQLKPLPDGLTVLVEPSENIGGGAPGNSTVLLSALLDHHIANAAIAICDPEAVQILSKLAIGERRTIEFGGRDLPPNFARIQLELELVRFGPGKFQLEDQQSHLASMSGGTFDMGPCAVACHQGITILFTSLRTPPFDLGQWRSQGIEPTKLSVIVVKAAVAHRRAYDPIAARMLWVDTPGPCTSNLKSLPYQRIQRPIYPLDL